MTSPNPDWALIIHADSGDTRVDVYWCDINAGREGLALAREVKGWRKRDDLLTLGNRFRVIETTAPNGGGDVPGMSTPDAAAGVPAPVADTSPPPWADVPADVPTVPQDESRTDNRRAYLRERVRAILGHSETAAMALQRAWPTGVPGLKQSGHSMEQLDAITEAVIRVETAHSVPWFPEWNDPAIEESRLAHPSNVWSRPWDTKPTDDDKEAIRDGLMRLPRRRLVESWIARAIAGGADQSVDTTALSHALYEFARVDESEWSDVDITLMLHGSLRAIGYPLGIDQLGQFNPDDAPLLMSAAFAIVAGNATLIFDDNGDPEVLTDVKPKSL
jgi:hypothetical protein